MGYYTEIQAKGMDRMGVGYFGGGLLFAIRKLNHAPAQDPEHEGEQKRAETQIYGSRPDASVRVVPME